MPAPNDRNSRIALAKGWVRLDKGKREAVTGKGVVYRVTFYWQKPDGVLTNHLPDFVATLKGVAGMLRELGQAWGLHFIEDIDKWCCYDHVGPGGLFYSEKNHPGDCVGEAWISVFGKEEA